MRQQATTISTALRRQAQRYATRSHLPQALAHMRQPNLHRKAWPASTMRHMLIAAPPLRGRRRAPRTWSARYYYNGISRGSTACPLANTYTSALSRRRTPLQPPKSAAQRACAPLRGASGAVATQMCSAEEVRRWASSRIRLWLRLRAGRRGAMHLSVSCSMPSTPWCAQSSYTYPLVAAGAHTQTREARLTRQPTRLPDRQTATPPPQPPHPPSRPHAHTRAHTHKHTHAHTHKHTRTHPHTRPRVHTRTHTHTHAHTHTHSHAHTHAQSLLLESCPTYSHEQANRSP